MKFFLLFIVAVVTLTSCGKDESTKPTSTPAKSDVSKSEEAVKKVEKEVSEIKEKVEEKVTEVEEKLAETTTKVEAETEKVNTEVNKVNDQVSEVATTLNKIKETLIKGNFEIACGKCMIKAEECKECQLTVKYEDQVYPVTGYDIDVKKLGLCATSANADIVGTLKDNILSVKTLENLKLNLPENLQKNADDALNKLKGLGF